MKALALSAIMFLSYGAFAANQVQQRIFIDVSEMCEILAPEAIEADVNSVFQFNNLTNQNLRMSIQGSDVNAEIGSAGIWVTDEICKQNSPATVNMDIETMCSSHRIKINCKKIETPATPVSVFDPAACTGPALTEKEAIALFPAGNSLVNLPVAELFSRERECNKFTGCKDWVEGLYGGLRGYAFGKVLSDKVNSSLFFNNDKLYFGTELDITGGFDSDKISFRTGRGLYGVETITVVGFYSDRTIFGQTERAYLYLGSTDFQLKGKLASNCMQFTAKGKSPILDNGSYTEYEYVVYRHD